MPDVGPLNPTRLVAIHYPDVPADLVSRLDELINAHENTIRILSESAAQMESLQGQTTGAVQQVLATSQGQASQALAGTWHPAQSDFRQAHQGMRDAASHLSTSNQQLLQQVPTIQQAMGTVEMLRSTGGYVSAMHADEVQAQIDKLSTALVNIGMALDAAAMMLNQLNGGWPLACATGFDPKGGFVPAFAPNAFNPLHDSSQMNMASNKANDPYYQRALELFEDRELVDGFFDMLNRQDNIRVKNILYKMLDDYFERSELGVEITDRDKKMLANATEMFNLIDEGDYVGANALAEMIGLDEELEMTAEQVEWEASATRMQAQFDQVEKAIDDYGAKIVEHLPPEEQAMWKERFVAEVGRVPADNAELARFIAKDRGELERQVNQVFETDIGRDIDGNAPPANPPFDH